MKLRHLILPLLAVFLLATGCTDEYYGSQIDTYQFNITPSEWMRNEGPNLPGADNYLYCEKKIPAIDNEVFERGTVQAYCWNVYDQQHNYGSWNTLPFVYPLEILIENDEGELERIIVAENLRFEWEKGKVTFVIQDLDGFDAEDMVSTISFKVCVTRNM